MSFIAGVLGYIGGLGATKLVLPFFTESSGVAVPIDPYMASGALLLSVILGLSASFYPAVLASRMDRRTVW